MFSFLLILWCIIGIIFGIVGLFLPNFKIIEFEEVDDFIFLKNGMYLKKRGKKIQL